MLAQNCSSSRKFFETPKYSSGHVECSFDNPAKNLSLKVQKFLAHLPKRVKSLKSFCSKSEIDEKVMFSKNFFSFKMCLWTRIMQF